MGVCADHAAEGWYQFGVLYGVFPFWLNVFGIWECVFGIDAFMMDIGHLMKIMLHKGNIYLFGIWQCVCVHWVHVFIFLDIHLVFGSVYLPLKMGVNGDHESKGWKSQRVLDLINFLRRRLVHGQDVHDANLHAEFSCSFNIKGNPFPRIRW